MADTLKQTIILWLLALLIGAAAVCFQCFGQEPEIVDSPILAEDYLGPILSDNIGWVGCGNVDGVSVLEAATRAPTQVKWWYRPGSFKNVPLHTQEAFLHQMAADHELVCNVDFVLVGRPEDAFLKFWFTSRENLRIETPNGPQYALGLHVGKGNIWLNKDRNINWPNANFHVPRETPKHECVHAFELQAATLPIDRWLHVQDRDCCYSIQAANKWWCPDDVLRLQKKFGQPSRTFYPKLKQEYGTKVRFHRAQHDVLIAQWQQAKDNRDATVDPVARAAFHQVVLTKLVEIRANLAELKKYADLWWAENDRWRAVPMVAGTVNR